MSSHKNTRIAAIGADARWASTYGPAALSIVITVTLARLVLLAKNPLNLYFDEAQYWAWSETPDFGYFSKPPLIAWIIAGTTSLFGDSEFAIRLASPLLHALTSWLLFVLGRELYDARTGFWAAAVYLTIPAVTLSSAIISTDVPLLAAWAAGLIALERAIARQSRVWAAATGAAFGVGLLAKYAMGYFALSLIVYAALSQEARRFLMSSRCLVALAVAASVVAPNVIWNLHHGFATVTHTASNANWGAAQFSFGELFDFLGAQFGVFGPLLFLMLLFGFVTLRSRLRKAGPQLRSDLYLLAFTLPVLIVVTVQAFISRANANWAATAYVAATALVAAWSLRILRPNILGASIVLHLGLAGVLYAAALSPAVTAGLDSLAAQRPVSNSFKRMKGWDEIGGIVAGMAAEAPYAAILCDDREDIAELFYYARPRSLPLLMWDEDGVPEDHFELTYPLKADPSGPVLYVTRRDPAAVLRAFAQGELLAEVSIDIGGGRTRDFRLFELRTLARASAPGP